MLSSRAFVSSCASETDISDSGCLSAPCGCGGVKTRAGSSSEVKLITGVKAKSHFEVDGRDAEISERSKDTERKKHADKVNACYLLTTAKTDDSL